MAAEFREGNPGRQSLQEAESVDFRGIFATAHARENAAAETAAAHHFRKQD
jgi:hypothetical protein